MTSYSSKEMNIMGAKAFVDSINESDGRSTKNSTILYAVLGKSTDCNNQMLYSYRNNQRQTLRYLEKCIGAKKINTTDVSHVVPRNDWVTVEFTMYKQTNINFIHLTFLF